MFRYFRTMTQSIRHFFPSAYLASLSRVFRSLLSHVFLSDLGQSLPAFLMNGMSERLTIRTRRSSLYTQCTTLEWLLLTTIKITSSEQARQCLTWYCLR